MYRCVCRCVYVCVIVCRYSPIRLNLAPHGTYRVGERHNVMLGKGQSLYLAESPVQLHVRYDTLQLLRWKL